MILLLAQLLTASIATNGAVTFTNLPPHVVFQHSRDFTNWFDMIEVKRLDGSNNWGSFAYTVTDNRVFVRARTP